MFQEEIQLCNAVFRVDSSAIIGSGHVMRCLAIAEFLREKNMNSLFISRKISGSIIDLVKNKGFSVAEISVSSEFGNDNTRAEITQILNIIKNKKIGPFFFDHYELNFEIERSIKGYCSKIIVIDDLANKNHFCDILINQNLGFAKEDYSGLISPQATLLLGPAFSLVNKRFSELRANSLMRRKEGHLKKIMISIGGGDYNNITLSVLATLNKANLDFVKLIVVLGRSFLWKSKVEDFIKLTSLSVDLVDGTDKIEDIMMNSDLAIGGGGSASWERCCLGLPSIIIEVAENQKLNARYLDKMKAGIFIGKKEDISTNLPRTIQKIMNRNLLKTMCENASKITDGTGIKKVYDFLY